VNFFKNLSGRSRTLVFVFIAIVAATLAWRKGFVGLTDSHAQRTERTSSVAAPDNRSESDAVDLTEKQAEAVKFGPVGSRDFELLKTAVGAIDFNENLLVQVFSQYMGKIIKANFNIGDDVKQGDVLFTIDSPDLLQAESTLLASQGVLELQKRTLTRVTSLLKVGGMAQKDVDQSTSDEQTAEGAYKAARDAYAFSASPMPISIKSSRCGKSIPRCGW
jgi:membrane fusion protein, heavy metal efflux system